MTRPVHGVLFDMDGLLLDTERLCLECFVQTRQQFGLEDGPETFLRCVGLRSADSDRVISESLPRDVEPQSFITQWNAWIETRLAEDIPVKRGALHLVQQLSASGYAMAVATSTKTAQARAHLKRAGLLPFLSAVVGGDLVMEGKPHPETYQQAAALIGLEPVQCVAFEDSETGTRAALASGALTVQVPDLLAPSATLAAHGHIIAPSLLEGAYAAGLISGTDT